MYIAFLSEMMRNNVYNALYELMQATSMEKVEKKLQKEILERIDWTQWSTNKTEIKRDFCIYEYFILLIDLSSNANKLCLEYDWTASNSTRFLSVYTWNIS